MSEKLSKRLKDCAKKDKEEKEKEKAVKTAHVANAFVSLNMLKKTIGA